MVPPDSHRISRARCYLGTRPGDSTFSCTGLSPSTATPSRGLPLTTLFYDFLYPRQRILSRPTTPTTQRLPAITCDRFSLIRFRSPLLTESRLFSLPVGTEMFHFPTFPPPALCVQAGVTGHDSSRVSPFGNPRITARLTAPRGLSQPPTSFIGSWCQGIHRAPLTTWPHKNPTPHTPGRKRQGGPTRTPTYRVRRCSRPLCSSQRTTRHPPHTPAGPASPTGNTAVREQGSPDRGAAPGVPRAPPVPRGRVRSLRTQQRAYNRFPAPTPFHAPPG